MTDEVKSIAGRLRDYIQRYADPTSFANPIKGTAEILRDAIDMIEELSGKVEGCETQIAGLETMLNTAQSAAKTWQRRAEAAERDLRSVIKDANDGCVLCAHYHPCAGKDCPQYVTGVGATGRDGKEYPDFKWSCEDFEFGTCPAMEATPCNGCDFENHWRWRGPCAENGGADGHGQVHLTQRQAATGQQDMISCETCRLYGRCGREQTDGLECCEDWENGGAK